MKKNLDDVEGQGGVERLIPNGQAKETWHVMYILAICRYYVTLMTEAASGDDLQF